MEEDGLANTARMRALSSIDFFDDTADEKADDSRQKRRATLLQESKNITKGLLLGKKGTVNEKDAVASLTLCLGASLNKHILQEMNRPGQSAKHTMVKFGKTKDEPETRQFASLPFGMKMTEYWPTAFAELRKTFLVDTVSFKESLSNLGGGGEGEGKSKMLFFYTLDKQFIIKTVKNVELSYMEEIFESYDKMTSTTTMTMTVMVCFIG